MEQQADSGRSRGRKSVPGGARATPGSRRSRRRLLGHVFLCVCGCFCSVQVGAIGNDAAFSLARESGWEAVPFPSDLFTVPDAQMRSGLRVDLPLPADPALVSERADVEAVNRLDGFSLFPRITVPLTGALPDASTFHSDNVFLVSLGPAAPGTVIPIDQRLIDDSIPGAPRLIFAPDVYLREGQRYAVVVTRGLTGVDGASYGQNDALRRLISRYYFGSSQRSDYEMSLYAALDTLLETRVALTRDIATLAVFTTRTVSDVPRKLLQRLEDGEVLVTRPTFGVDGTPGTERIAAQDIIGMESFLHRASSVADGSTVAGFPADTLRIKKTEVDLADDLSSPVYIQNERNGAVVRVPASAVNAADGSIAPIRIGRLYSRAGDVLSLYVGKRGFGGGLRRPHLWDRVGAVAIGRVEVPVYVDATGRLPRIPTGSEAMPAPTGTQSMLFVLFLPVGRPPDGGWPLVHFLHGGAEHGPFPGPGTFTIAASFAASGMATAAFPALEFNGGERTKLAIHTSNGSVVLADTGRGLDLNADGRFEKTETYPYPQRLSDLGVLIRALQLGVDVDGDAQPDVTTSPERTSVTGLSYGGATTFMAAALETQAEVFVSNVPATSGSRGRSAGYQPVVWDRGRAFAETMLGAREPPLLNGPSPVWGRSFDENIPRKHRPVQVGGMVPGAEAIQRAMDFMLWRDLEHNPIAYADAVRSGAWRGGPAAHLMQVVRGDGAAVNPLHALMITSGAIADQTAAIRLDREPAFDAQYGVVMAPELARHLIAWFPYSGDPVSDPGGELCELTRLQIAEFLRQQGASVLDPDADGGLFAGDVFEYPVAPELVAEMFQDAAVPGALQPGAP